MSYPAGNHIIGHGGGAFPRTGVSMRFNPATGNGIAILMTGGKEMIDPYMQDWMYWETGKMPFDIHTVFNKRLIPALILIVTGAVLIVFRIWKRFPSRSNHTLER